MRRTRFFAIPLAASMALSACVAPRPFTPRAPEPTPPPAPPATVQTQPAPTPEPVVPTQPLPAPTPPVRPRTLSPASKTLIAQAQAQSNAGNDSLAAATIERALRIESDNPLLWLELAKIRQNEGNSGQAENLARKALAMSTGDARTQATAWRLIAESLRARGRNPEARDAEAKASALAGG